MITPKRITVESIRGIVRDELFSIFKQLQRKDFALDAISLPDVVRERLMSIKL